jgi:1-deoxy-D-xylulose-5-phosphate reductoisomerase
VLGGDDGVAALALESGADIVVCAVVGTAGLRPVMAAVEAGTDVALATKEVLVAAGESVTAACARTGARLLPVDSEHSAIFQCLGAGVGRPPFPAGFLAQVDRLVLTASGGPFWDKAGMDLSSVSADAALKHPRWRMGKKVTVDSATLMNKGLEIMEAHWLFGLPLDRIDTVIHPESIVHSLVQFKDGNMLAQLSPPDMRFAIQYALTFPDRPAGGLQALRLDELGALHFARTDTVRFPCLGLAREAAGRGGTMPAVLNAANEAAVEAFLAGHLRFPGIWDTVARVMSLHTATAHPRIEEVIAADKWARETVRGIVRARGVEA